VRIIIGSRARKFGIKAKILKDVEVVFSLRKQERRPMISYIELSGFSFYVG